MKNQVKLLSLSLIGAFVGIATQGFAQMYTVTDLGILGGASFGLGVNDSGEVVGYYYDTSSVAHAFLYENSTMTNIGGSTGPSQAEGINATGEVTGLDNANHAFIYDTSTSTMTDLGTLGGNHSEGFSINNSGEVTGSSFLSNGQEHPFLYDGSSMKDISLASGSGQSINTAGDVVGYYYDSKLNSDQAFLDHNGTVSDIGTLGGSDASAYGINDSGLIVGQSLITNETAYHAFSYNGTMKDLGTLGGLSSYALGVNNSGQIVGISDTSTANHPGAFLYSGGQMTDLNTLIASNSGWQLQYATSISNNGYITGYGSLNGGADQAFLLTPQVVPEPGMIVIAVIAVGFGFFKIKK